jgi:hypothetical protein
MFEAMHPLLVAQAMLAQLLQWKQLTMPAMMAMHSQSTVLMHPATQHAAAGQACMQGPIQDLQPQQQQQVRTCGTLHHHHHQGVPAQQHNCMVHQQWPIQAELHRLLQQEGPHWPVKQQQSHHHHPESSCRLFTSHSSQQHQVPNLLILGWPQKWRLLLRQETTIRSVQEARKWQDLLSQQPLHHSPQLPQQVLQQDPRMSLQRSLQHVQLLMHPRQSPACLQAAILQGVAALHQWHQLQLVMHQLMKTALAPLWRPLIHLAGPD